MEEFREKLRQGKLVIYKNPDELKTHVWHALTHAFRLKPGEGWVRARRAQRIEELNEINALQKQVMDLRAENASLRESLQGFE